MSQARRPRLDVGALEEGVLAGDRAVLAQAITLVESRKGDHRVLARELLTRLAPRAGQAIRVGITGIPGAGKSTLIDGLGTLLTGRGHRVAVLAVDPSSERTGGSILGDKTRMDRLAMDPRAFVRPSPTRGTLGGVAARTRESMILCEAAGYDVIIVETVGVGQSETAVAQMTDVFVVLVIAGAGDQLQGIKRGVMELADLVAVNKADGDRAEAARAAAAEFRAAMRLLRGSEGAWRPEVLTCSALTGDGLEPLWERVRACLDALVAHGELALRRRRQTLRWLWQLVDEGLRARFDAHPGVGRLAPGIAAAVEAGTLPPTVGAERLLAAFAHPDGADERGAP